MHASEDNQQECIITDRVRSTRREVIVSLSFSVHTCGEGGGVSDLAGGYPCGGVPQWGVPHLGYPPSDLAGGVPHLKYPPPPVRPGWGLVPPSGGGYPTSGNR